MEAVLTERPDWCDDPKRPGTQNCAGRLAETLGAALRELREAYGDDMSEWRWGRAHIAVFANPVLSRIPILRNWFSPSISTGGAADTVDHAPSLIRNDQHPYQQAFGAGLRIITDLASPENSRMIVTPGQSGNPLSGHFADLLRRWRDFGLLVPGRAPAMSTLELVSANE
jgi:penicillin amidase